MEMRPHTPWPSVLPFHTYPLLSYSTSIPLLSYFTSIFWLWKQGPPQDLSFTQPTTDWNWGIRQLAMAVELSKTRDGSTKQIILLWSMIFMFLVLPVVRAEDEVAEGLNSNLAVIEMKLPNLYPESFDWDAKHNRFLVGSMGQGKLVTVTEEGLVEDFIQDEEYAGAAILGVRVDSIRNRVLAVVHRASNPRLDALAAYDLDSKARTLFVNLLEDEDEGLVQDKAVANDVAADGDGNAFVTNSGGNSIWKVSLEGAKSVFLPSMPQQPIVVEDAFVKTCSSNGIVYHDGHLLVGQSNSGALFRVRVADKHVEVVKLRDGLVMAGADGMAFRPDGGLVVVSVDTAWLLSSRDGWESATLIAEVALDEAFSTTGGAVNGSRVFTLHSHYPGWQKGLDHESFKIVEIKFDSDVHDNPLWVLAIAGVFIVLVVCFKFQMNQFNTMYTKKRV